MHFWKCWHDTRSFFLVFLIIAAAIMPIAAVACIGTGLLENFGSEAFRSTFEILTLFVALALGALGASEQFAGTTVHFLFTKPRSRAYFLWSGWLVGCAQLLALTIVNLVVGAVTLSHYGNNPFHSVLFGSVTARQLVAVLILGLYVYCLTYSLTVVLRNGLRGLGASMAIVFGIPFFAIAVRWRWKVNFPIPAVPIERLSPLVSNIIWTLVALLFVFAAQLVIDRIEI
jgi:hypothetical protein